MWSSFKALNFVYHKLLWILCTKTARHLCTYIAICPLLHSIYDVILDTGSLPGCLECLEPSVSSVSNLLLQEVTGQWTTHPPLELMIQQDDMGCYSWTMFPTRAATDMISNWRTHPPLELIIQQDDMVCYLWTMFQSLWETLHVIWFQCTVNRKLENIYCTCLQLFTALVKAYMCTMHITIG